MFQGRNAEFAVAGDELNLVLGDGATFVHNMGCGIVIVDQVDECTQAVHRVVLTVADLEAMLAWMK